MLGQALPMLWHKKSPLLQTERPCLYPLSWWCRWFESQANLVRISFRQMSFPGIDFKIAITYPHYLVPHTFWVVNTSVQYLFAPCVSRGWREGGSNRQNNAHVLLCPSSGIQHLPGFEMGSPMLVFKFSSCTGPGSSPSSAGTSWLCVWTKKEKKNLYCLG